MGWQMVVPLNNIMEKDVDNDLERNDDDGEQEVEHEVLDLDSIQVCDYCFVVKHPEQSDKEWSVQ